MGWYRYENEHVLLLTLHIQTCAKKTEVVGLYGDALKLKLAAAPIDGKANAVLLKFLAKCFQVPRSQVTLRQGDKSRHKIVEINASTCRPDILHPLNQI